MIAMILTREVTEGSRIAGEVLRCLGELPVELQRQILDYAEALAPRPKAGTGGDLLAFLGLDEEEARGIAAALEVG